MTYKTVNLQLQYTQKVHTFLKTLTLQMQESVDSEWHWSVHTSSLISNYSCLMSLQFAFNWTYTIDFVLTTKMGKLSQIV